MAPDKRNQSKWNMIKCRLEVKLAKQQDQFSIERKTDERRNMNILVEKKNTRSLERTRRTQPPLDVLLLCALRIINICNMNGWMFPYVHFTALVLSIIIIILLKDSSKDNLVTEGIFCSCCCCYYLHCHSSLALSLLVPPLRLPRLMSTVLVGLTSSPRLLLLLVLCRCRLLQIN